MRLATNSFTNDSLHDESRNEGNPFPFTDVIMNPGLLSYSWHVHWSLIGTGIKILVGCWLQEEYKFVGIINKSTHAKYLTEK